jgi:hypothetical protein
MGFGKAFLFSMLAFVGLNFIFTIIIYAFGLGFDVLFTTIQTAPFTIIYFLFGSILSAPSTILYWTIAEPFLLSTTVNLILGLGHLATGIITAILAGRFGESKIQSFGGWLLTAVISTVAVIIGALMDPTIRLMLSTVYSSSTVYVWGTFDVILFFALINCVINIVFYGFFALLISKVEYY